MLITYIGLFLLWRAFPSRVLFLGSGLLVVAGLVWGMIRAARDGYFTNRVDVRLHALVIFDVLIETASFEIFRLFNPQAVVAAFHNNTNFIGCVTVFALLIGGYRSFAARPHDENQGVSATVSHS